MRTGEVVSWAQVGFSSVTAAVPGSAMPARARSAAARSGAVGAVLMSAQRIEELFLLLFGQRLFFLQELLHDQILQFGLAFRDPLLPVFDGGEVRIGCGQQAEVFWLCSCCKSVSCEWVVTLNAPLGTLHERLGNTSVMGAPMTFRITMMPGSGRAGPAGSVFRG